ncbi:MAG: GTP-binding protein [Calditrichia bacterium]|nr:GTP-binding protein [Calditrichia bacterium]
MNSNSVLKKKICLIGSYGVGKTSLIKRYVYDQFDDKYLSTIGVKVTKKILPPIESNQKKLIQLELLIWDIEGYEKNIPVIEEYYMGSTGAFAVADISRTETIDHLADIVKGYLKVVPDSKIVLVGNKIDLKSDKSGLKEKFVQFANQLNLKSFFTSAKTGENVESVFTYLGEIIIKSI